MTVVWTTDQDMTPGAASAEKAAQDAVRTGVRDALLASGADGLTNRELYARFGPSAIKRLNDLKRHDGYTYTRAYVAPRTWRYVLHLPSVNPAPAARITPAKVRQAARILAAHARALATVARRSGEPRPLSLFADR